MKIIYLSAIAGLLASQGARAQEASPILPNPPSPWRLYVEAGPKVSIFENTYRSSTYLVPTIFNPTTTYYRNFEVRNTIEAFAGVKALRQLGRHWQFAGGLGLDMQQLDFTTSWRLGNEPASSSAFEREHVVRLLTRVRVEAGANFAINLGDSQLLPGLGLGQQLNISRNGFGYSFGQASLSFAHGPLLVSFSSTFTPYNLTIPDVDDIARRDERPTVERNEYRITELRLGVGVKI